MSSLKAVTAAEMRAIDRRATEEFGIPSLLLMENAGRGVADLVQQEFSAKRIVVFAGKGNNGGDGFVTARHLHNRGYSVTIFLLADPRELKGDAALNFEIVSKMKIPIASSPKDFGRGSLIKTFGDDTCLIDAIFGVGLSKPLEGIYAEAMQAMNQSGKKILSIDVPSGLDADTGEIRGAAVKATVTAALGLLKKGLTLREGPAQAGKLCVVDIGLPIGVIS